MALFLTGDDGAVPVALEADVLQFVIGKALKPSHFRAVADRSHNAADPIARSVSERDHRPNWAVHTVRCCHTAENIS
ncbi:MAG TPA: hypothetical protein VE079_01150 [Ensifer sp.]|nr:hypothetical protein [Ensifer sp.]